MLTISHPSFQNSCEVKTGLSDFHNMAVTAENIFYKKEPKIVSYRSHKTIPMMFLGNFYLINLLNYRYVMKCQLYKLVGLFVQEHLINLL